MNVHQRAVLSTTARRSLMHNRVTSHRGSSPPCTRHPIHACAPVCCVVVDFSSTVSVLYFRSTALLPALPRCSPQCSTRSLGPTPCATSAWGPWPLLTTRHPSQNLRNLHMKHYHMSTAQFKKRTSHLDIQHMVKTCSSCNSNEARDLTDHV